MKTIAAILRVAACLLFGAPFAVARAEERLPELEVKEIEEGVYLHTSYERYEGWGIVASNGLVVIDGADANIVDTPSTAEDTAKLAQWIRERGYAVAGSLSTHFHADSSGGIAYLNQNSIPTYASRMTNELIAQAGREEATRAFDAGSYWWVPGRIEAYYPGGGHTKDNIVVWLPRERILFGGCFVKSGGLGNLDDATLEDWPASADKLLARYGAAKQVVPGHGEIGDRSLLEETKRLALQGLNERAR